MQKIGITHRSCPRSKVVETKFTPREFLAIPQRRQTLFSLVRSDKRSSYTFVVFVGRLALSNKIRSG